MIVTTQDLLDVLGIMKELSNSLCKGPDTARVSTMIDTMLKSVDNRLIADQMTTED